MSSRAGDSEPAPTWLREAGATPGDSNASRRAGPSLPEPGDIIAGRYKIDCIIGKGGMGAVFRATHTVIKKPVAVKWMAPELSSDPEMRDRFVREAQVAARISHPNVVDVYDVGVQDGALFMVMQLLEGETFEAVGRRGEMPIPHMLHLLVQAMRGVAAAHAVNVVHRDIKPDNIFVVADSTQPFGLNAKVLDFGISKLSVENDTGAITKSGMTLGTPAYMPHEQINSARDVDARADVYAFGVLMYRALTGRLPFQGETLGAIAVAIAHHNPPSPKVLRPDLPTSLSDVVVKAMARRPEDRFGDAGELLEQLESLSTVEGYLGQMTHPSTSPPRITPRTEPATRVLASTRPASAPAPTLVNLPKTHTRGWTAAAGIASVAVALVAWSFWEPGADTATPNSERIAATRPPIAKAARATTTTAPPPPRDGLVERPVPPATHIAETATSKVTSSPSTPLSPAPSPDPSSTGPSQPNATKPSHTPSSPQRQREKRKIARRAAPSPPPSPAPPQTHSPRSNASLPPAPAGAARAVDALSHPAPVDSKSLRSPGRADKRSFGVDKNDL